MRGARQLKGIKVLKRIKSVVKTIIAQIARKVKEETDYDF